MKRVTLILIIYFTIISLGCETNNLTINQRYPLPWREPSVEEFQSLGSTIVKNGLTDCGEYYVRQSSEDHDEYLVACTSDGINFNYYIIWPTIEKMMIPSSSEKIESPKSK